jgi:hypothetical protein
MATLHFELIAAVPKRHIMTANEFLWPQTTMSEKDSHTMSVWVTISNAVWGWSKYWACYWICNSDGIMEYDFPFSCGAPTTVLIDELRVFNYIRLRTLRSDQFLPSSQWSRHLQHRHQCSVCRRPSMNEQSLCQTLTERHKQMSFSRNNHILSWAFVTSFGYNSKTHWERETLIEL